MREDCFLEQMEFSCKCMNGLIESHIVCGRVSEQDGIFTMGPVNSQKFLDGFALIMMTGVKLESLLYHVPNNLSFHYLQNILEKGITTLDGCGLRGKVSSWVEEGKEVYRRLQPQETKPIRDLEDLQNISGKSIVILKEQRLGVRVRSTTNGVWINVKENICLTSLNSRKFTQREIESDSFKQEGHFCTLVFRLRLVRVRYCSMNSVNSTDTCVSAIT